MLQYRTVYLKTLELLKSYSLEKMFDLFNQKFPNTNQFHILKSLTYFNDAELEPNPQTPERINM